jgi:predicted amidophosphoribosyltransferase
MEPKKPQDYKKVSRPSKQVLTIVDFSAPQATIRLECSACHAEPPTVGAKFCSNCGEPLKWDNIFIRQPQPTEVPTDEFKAKDVN